ncbi:hypothetical protein [Streptomyces morookaense]|uniref:Uncharacterized protein n=1 Tax=Streptomyces morookaense TaxID=1970 RepID=A0A7Y7B006_STRMO|nr:hypothetical protein [Streptomyces morookaense]NVK76345.1 hypothetical protein [Streptomyces morookaense]GHF39155.1 hypothetical protein GCM10010359_47470 [Streptomyces morookaense]
MAVRTAAPTTGWLLRGKDGRLTAYAPAQDGLTRWTETRPGGPGWSGPQHLAMPGLEPYLSIAQTPEGYVYLTGLRRREHEDGRAETDVVYTTQFQTGRAVTNWRTIGTPYGRDWERADQMGAPTAVVDAEGLFIALRNAGNGLSARKQDAKGIWGPWLDLHGSRLLDTVSAAATGDGRAELLAVSSEVVLRWRQEEPGGEFVRTLNTPAKPVPGSLASVSLGDGRVAHFWRDAADSALLAQYPEAGQEGAEAPAPVPLASPDPGGSGPVAALRAAVDGRLCLVLAQRAASGRVAVAVVPDGQDDPAAVSWAEVGTEPCAGAPALALDGDERVVLAFVAEGGGLRVARQRAAGAELEFGEWERA